jgi:hypothetical protein
MPELARLGRMLGRDLDKLAMVQNWRDKGLLQIAAAKWDVEVGQALQREGLALRQSLKMMSVDGSSRFIYPDKEMHKKSVSTVTEGNVQKERLDNNCCLAAEYCCFRQLQYGIRLCPVYC